MEERRVRTTFILELNFLLRKKSVSLYTTVLEVGVGRIAIVCVVRPNLLCSSIELSCLDGFDQNNFRYSFIFPRVPVFTKPGVVAPHVSSVSAL